MIISENPKFICFQPWKCGSTTLYHRLETYNASRYPQSGYYNKILKKRTHKHIALDDFSRLPESKQDYVRFVFVRNPYDRLYSGFLQRKNRLKNGSSQHQSSAEIKKELDFIDRGFSAFVEFFLDRFRQGRGGPSSLHQHVYHDGQVAVDFVGFLETFEASFSQVCDRIDLHGVNSKNANVRHAQTGLEVPEFFEATRYRYIDKFDSRTVEAVNDVLADDFKPLGYRMVDPNALRGNGQGEDVKLCPFSDIEMPERKGQLLVFHRLAG